MKKILTFIIFSLSLCSAWSQSVEQRIKKVLLETKFRESGIYDGTSYTFKEKNGNLLWERESCNENVADVKNRKFKE